MERPTGKRKRARPSASPDEDGDGDDKKRGRPRVEKEDESAADRRRTQIRMAQRAYRQRKESTLDELRRRVSDLTSTVEVMNQLFVECRDRLYTANLPHPQMADLENVSKRFDELVKDARDAGENDDQEPSNPVHHHHHKPSTSSNIETRSEDISQPKNVPSWLDQSVLSTVNKLRLGPMDVGMGYTMYMPEADEHQNTDTYAALDSGSIPQTNADQLT